MVAIYVPSVHYLVDLYDTPLNDPNPPYLSAKINDVISATSGTSEMSGNFVVRVPGDVSMKNPRNLRELLIQKYSGLLAAYAGFTEIVWDDMLDPGHVDTTHLNFRGRVGDRSSIALNPGRQLRTVPITPIPGVAPSQAVVTWEVFDCLDYNPKDGRLVRTYAGRYADAVSTCEVSFDGGVSFYAVADGGAVNIPPASQGTNLVLQILNTSANPIHLGSWAVIY